MKRIEVKLHLPAVAPLLDDVIKGAADSLRDELALPPRSSATGSASKKSELIQRQNGDVRFLIALFDENFASTGAVNVFESTAAAILRACSALRIRLRGCVLASLSDEMLQAGKVEVAQLAEPMRGAFTGYVFLATLQDIIIKNFEVTLLKATARPPAFEGFTNKIRVFFHNWFNPLNPLPAQKIHPTPGVGNICWVVVLNDPVNLMSYVSVVLRITFGFDYPIACRHMLEVHEQGRSVVWSGLRDQAERLAYTLQQWHLTAILEPDETH